MLTDPNFDVKNQAALELAIERTKYNLDSQFLLSVLENTNLEMSTRMRAADAVITVLETIFAVFDGSDAVPKRLASNALLKLRAPDVIDRLIDAFDTADTKTRTRFAVVLEKVKGLRISKKERLALTPDPHMSLDVDGTDNGSV